MKKLFLLLTLFGVLTVGCENLFPNEQVPNSNSVFVTDGEDVYIVGADGGDITIVVTTNEEYSVIIPDEATSWISVTNTRTDVRIDKLYFSLLANDSFVDRTATIKLVDSKNQELQKIVFVQKCYDKVFEIDADGNYLVDAEGGEVNVDVTTNLEYNVAIPEDAQSWLSVADSRATVREETLTFVVAKNNSYEERSASVELVDSKGDVLQTIGFIQSAVEMCPSNEIWYTNGSTTEPTAPYNTSVFGANIVSNTFDAEKECWVIEFDGDVTTIGDRAFDECSSLISVTIPDSVTTIGYAAFYYCSGLTSVTIGDSVTTIGYMAFYNCSSLSKFNGKYASEDGRCLIVDGTLNSFAIGCGVTEYTIPDSVTTIGSYAFYGCSSLTSVTIPDSVTTIGGSAFYECSNLTSVTIPDSVTTIGGDAFRNCSSLTSVTIGTSVTTIGDAAFEFCSSLTEFNGKFASEDGRCLIIDGTLNSFAIGCGVTEYTIPDNVTIIGYMAFAYCSSLTSVIIPDSVTTIGDCAFCRCYSLTSATIPDSVTTIGYAAFSGCSSLTSVTIPDSVTTIGGGVFSGCSSLTSVTIGDSVTTIGHAAFHKCSSLTSVTIPDSVTTIGDEAFWDCSSLTSVIIPDSVTTIGTSAFVWCSSLTSVTIGDSVTTIGSFAFDCCISLTSVTIPDSVTTIGENAFYDCRSLTSVYCKATTPPATILDDYGYWDAFDNNASGRKIYVPTESVEAYKSSEGWSEYADAIVGYEF